MPKLIAICANGIAKAAIIAIGVNKKLTNVATSQANIKTKVILLPSKIGVTKSATIFPMPKDAPTLPIVMQEAMNMGKINVYLSVLMILKKTLSLVLKTSVNGTWVV